MKHKSCSVSAALKKHKGTLISIIIILTVGENYQLLTALRV